MPRGAPPRLHQPAVAGAARQDGRQLRTALQQGAAQHGWVGGWGSGVGRLWWQGCAVAWLLAVRGAGAAAGAGGSAGGCMHGGGSCPASTIHTHMHTHAHTPARRPRRLLWVGAQPGGAPDGGGAARPAAGGWAAGQHAGPAVAGGRRRGAAERAGRGAGVQPAGLPAGQGGCACVCVCVCVCAAGRTPSLPALHTPQRPSCPLAAPPLPLPPPQGLDEPKLVFQVLPALLRGRQYEDLPTTARASAPSRHHSLGGASAHASHSSWGVVGSLRRQASVELGSSEATPRQVGSRRGWGGWGWAGWPGWGWGKAAATAQRGGLRACLRQCCHRSGGRGRAGWRLAARPAPPCRRVCAMPHRRRPPRARRAPLPASAPLPSSAAPARSPGLAGGGACARTSWRTARRRGAWAAGGTGGVCGRLAVCVCRWGRRPRGAPLLPRCCAACPAAGEPGQCCCVVLCCRAVAAPVAADPRPPALPRPAPACPAAWRGWGWRRRTWCSLATRRTRPGGRRCAAMCRAYTHTKSACLLHAVPRCARASPRLPPAPHTERVAVCAACLRCRSYSVASSGGSLMRGGWLGALGARISGALGRRSVQSGHPSELGSPRSGGFGAPARPPLCLQAAAWVLVVCGSAGCPPPAPRAMHRAPALPRSRPCALPAPCPRPPPACASACSWRRPGAPHLPERHHRQQRSFLHCSSGWHRGRPLPRHGARWRRRRRWRHRLVPAQRQRRHPARRHARRRPGQRQRGRQLCQ